MSGENERSCSVSRSRSGRTELTTLSWTPSSVRACVRASVHACMRACVRACMGTCVRACVRALRALRVIGTLELRRVLRNGLELPSSLAAKGSRALELVPLLRRRELRRHEPMPRLLGRRVQLVADRLGDAACLQQLASQLGPRADQFRSNFRRMRTANAEGLDQIGGKRRKDLSKTRL